MATRIASWAKQVPSLNVLGYSDIGCERDTNEDAMAWDTTAGVVALADGMGGYQAGEVASAMAVSLFTNGFRCWLDEVGEYLANETLERQAVHIKTWLMMQVQSIHDSILDAAALNADCMGMGTTLCGVVVWGDCAWVAHVGDSRVYTFDRATHSLRCLTRDHSVFQERMDDGVLSEAEARPLAQRHVLTRAIGVGDTVFPDIAIELFTDKTLLVLCSDGFSNVVNESLMVRVLKEHSTALAGRLLLSQAMTLGGQDNISIVLMEKAKSLEA